jgi:hypothetical protein
MKMLIRFIFIVLPLMAITLGGCKKDKLVTGQPNYAAQLGTMPAQFVQRVMLEETTGEWCSNCPDGAAIITQLQQQYGDTLVPVSVHCGDFLDYSAVYQQTVDAFFQGTPESNITLPGMGVPSGATNRVNDIMYSYNDIWYTRSDWSINIISLLQTNYQTGIALITSIQGDSAVIEVHVGFHQTNNYDMRLNVFLVENNIPQQNQQNATLPYFHQQVLRNIPTPVLGDPVSMSTIQEIIKTYKVPITGYVAANLVVAASVEKWGTDPSDRAVFNARQVALGQIARWQ